MKKTTIKRIVGIAVIVAIIAATIVTLMSNKKIAADRVFEYDKTAPINVTTQKLSSSPLASKNRYSGTFQPSKEVKLSADTQGKITKIVVENGDIVKEGQPLLELDKSMITLQLEAINTKISGLEKDIARYTSLVESNAIQGVTLEKALLGLEGAKIEKATIQEQLNKSTIRAPFDGVITAKLTELGAFAAPGVPLFQLTDISTLQFIMFVTEHEINQFQVNDTIQLSVDAIPEEEFSGAISMVGSKANNAMNFPVEVSVNNKSMHIKAGMFGRATTSTTHQANQGILIPLSAVIGESSTPQVYVVESGKARLRTIQLDGTIANKAIVKSGLNEDDIIIIEGITNLFEGANVITK
jgi:membrane fusion protein, multidrug efflux system